MPAMTLLAEALLIDGTDLQSLTGVFVEDWSGLLAPGARRGNNDVLPGKDGELGAQLPFDAYTFTVPVLLLPTDDRSSKVAVTADSRATFLANLNALAAVCLGTNGGLVNLTRRLTTSTGHVDHTANGQFLGGLNATSPNMVTGSLSLQFRNLDGCWHDGTTVVVP